MTTSPQAILDLIALARGERPLSLDSWESEMVLNIALSLAVELAVSNDRIAALESAVARLSGQTPEAWQAEAAARADVAGRAEATEAMLLRVLRVVLDPRTPTGWRD